jgi:hypothetical protein
MADEVDYEKLLADVEAEIVQLQGVAAFARKKLGLAADATVTVPAAQVNQLTASTIPSDAFFRMGVAEAIQKYLGIVKQPKPVNAITEALMEGGLPTKSQNLYTTVYTALIRGQGKIFSKVKKDWGLTEWYR